MKTTTKRRGRSKKVVPNPADDSSVRGESNFRVADCNWTALGSPYGLKIVLKKVDVKHSALVCHQNEVKPTSNENFKFLSPQLTLPRIDSTLPRIDTITEQNISFVAIDNGEDGQSVQHVYSSYSVSKSVICSPEIGPVVTQRLYSMNAYVEDSSPIRRRSRRILKDVKNTSNNRELRKTISVQHNLDGQENVPVVSNYSTSVAVPQVTVSLPQLDHENLSQHNLMQGKYVESSSMVNFLPSGIKSSLQSLTMRGISSGEPSNSSMIMGKFTQTNEIKESIRLEAAELLSLDAAPPAKKGRKRKSLKRKTALESSEEPKEKIACPKNSRPSPIVTRRKAAANDIIYVADTSSRGIQCETISSSEISQNTVKRRLSDNENRQIIREEATLQICRTSFDDQQNNDIPESPSGLQQNEFTVNISTVSTVEFHYPSKEEKTIEKSEQSFRLNGKRKWRVDPSNESSGCSAPKKRPFGNNNCDKVNIPFNGLSKCVVHINRIQNIQQSPKVVCSFQSPENSGNGARAIQPSSYVTRNKASKKNGSVKFYQIPWKQIKGIEDIKEKPAKSNVKEICFPAKKSNDKLAEFVVEESSFPTTKKLNEKPAKFEKTSYPPKPKVKRKRVKAQKKSSKTNSVNSYSSYRTRQKTAQNGEPTEFYRLPWKKTKGLEVVSPKSKRMDTKFKADDAEPDFKGWPKKNFSAASTTIPTQDAETSISKKGILKHNDLLASSTPFPESSRRNANVSFVGANDEAEVRALSPVKSHQKTNTTSHLFNGLPIRSCTVVLTCIPDPVPQSPQRNKRCMTRREARKKTESVNKSRKASEAEAKSDRSNSNSPSKKTRRRTKRHPRSADKQLNYRIASETSSSSEEEQEILVNRNKPTTPYVRLRKLNAADITSYKITPLKEDRIPKKSKTDDDYGIDDINTDDSTDDEEFPKKCIPKWVADHKNQPQCQSYLRPNIIYDWMKPPQFQFSLRHVFFSMKSHTFM